MMLTIYATAALLSTNPVPPSDAQPAAVRVSAQVSIRILQGARVEGGRSPEPHSRGIAQVVEGDGRSRTLQLIEFP